MTPDRLGIIRVIVRVTRCLANLFWNRGTLHTTVLLYYKCVVYKQAHMCRRGADSTATQKCIQKAWGGLS